MCGSGEKMLDEVAFLFSVAPSRVCIPMTPCATSLCTKRAHGRALDKAPMRDADDASPRSPMRSSILISASAGTISVRRGEPYLSRFRAVPFDNRGRRAASLARISCKSLMVSISLLVFLVDLVSLETGSTDTAEVENFVGLLLAECIPPIWSGAQDLRIRMPICST